jgi:hypothetical protein
MMAQFYGIQILMENTASQDLKRIKDHYNHVRKTYGDEFFGKQHNHGGNALQFHRYKELRNALIPTLNEIETIADIVMNNACK